MLTIAKYLMLQLFGKLWAPVFDNPVSAWWLDTYVDWVLRAYYWPILLGLELQEIGDFYQANLCNPTFKSKSH